LFRKKTIVTKPKHKIDDINVKIELNISYQFFKVDIFTKQM